MKVTIKSPQQFVNLKKQCENFHTINAEAIEGMSTKNLLKIIHNFQVYQVELEMQNEALKNERTALEISKKNYSDLYHLAPCGYLTFNNSWDLIDVNHTCANMLGVKKEIFKNRGFNFFIDFDSKGTFYCHQMITLIKNDKQTCELASLRQNREKIKVRLESKVIGDIQQDISRILTTITNLNHSTLKKCTLKEKTEEDSWQSFQCEQNSYFG
jgi:PAS domain-containing protein